MDLSYPLGIPLDLARLCERICSLNPRLRAIRAMKTPDPKAALHVLVKDNIGLTGFTTPAGSFALRNLRLSDAFCVKALKRSGIDVFGKTNMTELAGFVTTTNPARGYSHIGGFGVNPHGEGFPCGGSSSGSAIAVAAGLCDAAIGTETRGSLMQPGLFCGVFSFKPTVGLVSRTGIVPLASSFDTPGVLARDMRTLEKVLLALHRADPQDPVTEVAEKITLESPSLHWPLRIGVLCFKGESISQDTRDTFERFACHATGVEFSRVEVSPIVFDYKRISSLEIMRDMSRFLAKHATGDTPKSFHELADIYKTHEEVRPYGMDRIDEALAMEPLSDSELKLLAQQNIERARERIRSALRQGPYAALVSLSFTDWWAIAGAPSLAIPLGKSSEGRPIGIMLGTEPGKDGELLAIGRHFASLLRKQPSHAF